MDDTTNNGVRNSERQNFYVHGEPGNRPTFTSIRDSNNHSDVQYFGLSVRLADLMKMVV